VVDPRSLDALDPPPWASAPTDATFLVRRCHELRTKPIDDFSVEDLRLMIGQQIGLPHLMPLALEHLKDDPLTEGDFFPGDLLTVVLRVEPSFGHANSLLAGQVHEVLDRVRPEAELSEAVAQQLADDLASFRASVRL
jgi:hypothetical protein